MQHWAPDTLLVMYIFPWCPLDWAVLQRSVTHLFGGRQASSQAAHPVLAETKQRKRQHKFSTGLNIKPKEKLSFLLFLLSLLPSSSFLWVSTAFIFFIWVEGRAQRIARDTKENRGTLFSSFSPPRARFQRSRWIKEEAVNSRTHALPQYNVVSVCPSSDNIVWGKDGSVSVLERSRFRCWAGTNGEEKKKEFCRVSHKRLTRVVHVRGYACVQVSSQRVAPPLTSPGSWRSASASVALASSNTCNTIHGTVNTARQARRRQQAGRVSLCRK